MDDTASLSQRVTELQEENATLKRRISEMEHVKPGSDVSDLPIPIGEFEETLRRLVQRTAMILQAEKCVIMIRDRETGDLFARGPAFGMTDNEVKLFRVHPDTGITGDVFRSGAPAIFHDASQDPRAIADHVSLLRVRNGVTVPLLIEKRDEQSRVTDRVTIGVLHCFNKRYGGEFIEEDVRLLERLSRNAAAVIANAQIFQEAIEEKDKLVHTFESLTAGLLLINQHGRIAQMNAQARAMFRVSPDTDPHTRPYREIITDPKVLAVLEQEMADPDHHEPVDETGASPRHPNEITLEDDEGDEYIYQLHGAGVTDDNNQPIGTVIIFNDITDIRNVDRMKTEFVSIVSHELRTPLTPMKGFVATLLQDENEEWYTKADRREFYGIIDQNVDRLSRLINDLLNVSRIERQGAAGIEMNFEDVDIRKAADAVVEIQKGMTDKHTLVVDFEPEHIIAETDIDKIQNILQNLVSNAIKYSPGGGEVRVIGRIEPTDESVLIGVQDHGTGIPESAQKKLFTKFYRVDNKSTRKVGGTGIGLFLVKHLVEAHKGQIWAESELGKGSTFWFRIPIHQPKQVIKDGDTAAAPVMAKISG